MPTISVLTMQGKEAGQMDLNEDIFGITPNTAAMHLVVRSILAAKRQGTQSALTRGMVRGGGRKIYRQKGTGRARHHSNRAPQFRHGGVVFAPSRATMWSGCRARCAAWRCAPRFPPSWPPATSSWWTTSTCPRPRPA